MKPALLFVGVVALSAGACAEQPHARAADSQVQPAASILVDSKPAAGSTVSGAIDNLELHFNPPARLDELAVSGPAGTMPMMVHAAGEQAHYSLPLSGIEPGTYSVNWRATAQGHEHRGSFPFTVR